jgi:predicted nucleotidyltransferase
LISVAEALRPILPELVFVGGNVAELLLTDPVASRIRETDDVDTIVQITTYRQYEKLGKRLERLGFSRDLSSGAPVCRWLTPPQNGRRIKVDVMPTAETSIGPANAWYKVGMETAQHFRLTDSLDIRILSAPAFLATKLAAFESRGNGDVLMSHDIEDVIAVVEGRPELVEELKTAPAALRSYVSNTIRAFLARDDFDLAIEDALPDARLTPGIVLRVRDRLASIAAMA